VSLCTCRKGDIPSEVWGGRGVGLTLCRNLQQMGGGSSLVMFGVALVCRNITYKNTSHSIKGVTVWPTSDVIESLAIGIIPCGAQPAIGGTPSWEIWRGHFHPPTQSLMVSAMAIVPRYTTLKMLVRKATIKELLTLAPRYIWEVIEIRCAWLSIAVTYQISYIPCAGECQ
jgi:hypothetical protein